ncbi:NADH-quinone oxidoreductase subunit N [Candidatus Viridilinea mediisalina]|uniref:NADH-quinone oxidoreductase subunit N n=1 Tax=Candidatus Viridilinea mediisalina TaxID=2024553 RepID=A0A2A6RM84_9CHLR|nr:NADH-quinone oxidoreductase subunit N [Candidatus Viridilinea mediisalina]PDW04016.1 NADH-quinone oxidoreductase subunit N [Candidatus Viridilinea mediisalina]
MFQITDIPRILPEILLLFLAFMVLGSDIFEKWGRSPAARLERARSSASLTTIGLGLIFVIALVQSGYVPGTAVAATAESSNPLLNYLINIVRNLQAGGPGGAPIIGVFATDHLTMVARLMLIGAAFLTSMLCLDYLPQANPAEFYAMIIFATLGMCLMAGANELIIAYLAVELTSIPLYVLAGYYRNDTRSAEAGMKYFLFGAISSGILLYGMSLAYGFAASAAGGMGGNDLTQFQRIAELARINPEAGTGLLMLAMIFIVVGMGYKVGVVPFHGWSPDVYQGAPTPVTAFISTASKAAGFILLFRLLTVAFPGLTGSATLGSELGGWTALLALLALLTLIIGNLAALPQTNAKRLLAWSSIAHAGFLLLGLIAWASPHGFDRDQGTVALLYYLVVYSLTNVGAFGALAAVMLTVGGEEIADLNGLAQRNLLLATLLTLCVLSLAGIPPLAGFFAKFYIFMVGWQAGAEWLVVVAVITTVISLYYYLRLLKAMFIEAPISNEPLRAPPAITASVSLAVAGLIILGIFPNLVLGVISRVQVVAGL